MSIEKLQQTIITFWLLQHEAILLGIIFVSSAVVVWMAFSGMHWIDPKHSLKDMVWGKESKKLETDSIKEYLPEILGALIGFVTMAQYPIWNLAGLIWGVILAHAGKWGYKQVYFKMSEEKRAGEVLLMYEVLSIYSKAGYALRDALEACLYLVTYKKPLQRCLRAWGQGPQRALDRFRADMKIAEAEALVSVLKRATIIGPGKLAAFLNEESLTMEKLRQMRVERNLGSRPIIQTLYLLFPGIALLGVTLGPIGYYIVQQIMAVRIH